MGDLWNTQDIQTREFDYGRYNTVPWVLLKSFFAICMMTLVYLLYALHELPWRLFGSVIGILILVLAPFFAGLILGFTFESPKAALAYSIIIGFVSVGSCMALMMLPGILHVTEFGFGLNKNVWFYGFFIPFLVTISFVPAGALVSSSTNVYE
ncbi:MAG: hypothetical protein PHU53_00185 [Thermoplasmata archaeon]|nr:hypothetical protein [Thermoplasmata archaeon]